MVFALDKELLKEMFMKKEIKLIDANKLIQSLKNNRLRILYENEDNETGVFDDILTWIEYSPEKFINLKEENMS